MRATVCISFLTLVLIEGCHSDLPQNKEAGYEGGSKTAFSTIAGKVDIADDGFTIVGMEQDSGNILLWENAYHSSAADIFFTEGKHNIPYGQHVNFYAIHPGNQVIETAGRDVLYRYDAGNGNTDVIAASNIGFLYCNDASGCIVPLHFRHILGGLVLYAAGQKEDSEYTIEDISIGVPSQCVYDFNAGEWDSDSQNLDYHSADCGNLHYLPPSGIEIRAKWSCRHNGTETAEYDARTTVAISMGRISVIKLILSDDDSGTIGFDVDINPWNQTSAEVDFSTI